MFFYFDPWYLLLVLPAVVLAGIAQLWVQSTFRKYSKVGTLRGVTGREASEEIQRRNGITLPVERVGGNLTDHYDPRTNVIRLSDPVYGVNSVAAVGVAAHETRTCSAVREGLCADPAARGDPAGHPDRFDAVAVSRAAGSAV